jgi:hypothetical protein
VGGTAGDPARQVVMARRPESRLAFEAVRTAIGAELKRRFSGVLSEPIPKAIADLLGQLDQPPGDVKTAMDDSS